LNLFVQNISNWDWAQVMTTVI